MSLHVRLAIECKVKLFKYIQIFSENTNFSWRALVAYVQYICQILTRLFPYFGTNICNEMYYAIGIYIYICMLQNVRKKDILLVVYMRLGNVPLTQWMSVERVEFIFFRSEIFCLFSLVIEFFLSQCFNIDLCCKGCKVYMEQVKYTHESEFFLLFILKQKSMPKV